MPRWLPPLAFAAAWCLALLLVDPRGSFPVNDDWAFAASVRVLVEEGRLAFTGWQSMPLLAHLGWGAGFWRLLGTQQEALRASTLVLAAAATALAYRLAREADAPRATSLLAAGLLLANPVFLALSFSYMSDVPFLAWLLAGVLLWLRGLRRGSAPLVAAGALLAGVATLSRQNGLAAPLGLLLGSARNAVDGRWVRRVLLPGVALVLLLLLTEALLEASVGLPALYRAKTGAVWRGLAQLPSSLPGIAERIVGCLQYLGLGLLPLLVLTGSGAAPDERRIGALWPFAGLGLGLATLQFGPRVPAFGNVWTGSGIGPLLTPGTPTAPPSWLEPALTIAAGLAAALLLARLASLASQLARRESWPSLSLAAVGIFTVAPMLVADARLFDRYLLPLLPLLAAVLAGGLRAPAAPGPRLAAWGLLAACFCFSLAAVHDYLAWQRARWEAVGWLMRGAAPPREQIAGGLELDNQGVRVVPDALAEVRGRTLWLVAVSPVGGYDVRRELPVGAWLPTSIGRVYVLERRARPPGRDLSPPASAGSAAAAGPRG